MYRHAPPDYICPFCLLASGIFNEHVWTTPSDIIHQDSDLTAFVSPTQWPNNVGHVVIVPNQHFENIFDLPVRLAANIHRLARAVALAMKQAYGCDGISTRQHNEPAGNQDVWHYHLHVFPRYEGDRLYSTAPVVLDAEVRARHARRLRDHLPKCLE